MRRIFGPRRDEETGGWRKLRNEELHNFFANYNVRVKEIEVGREYSTNGKDRNACRLLVGKRTLERPRRRCVDNIRADFGETDWGVKVLAEDRDKWRAPVSLKMNFLVP
jgi:hypothetical protein